MSGSVEKDLKSVQNAGEIVQKCHEIVKKSRKSLETVKKSRKSLESVEKLLRGC